MMTLSIRARVMALAAALGLIIVVLGGYNVSKSLDAFARLQSALETVRHQYETLDDARSAQVEFQLQVHEWKDVHLKSLCLTGILSP